MTEAQKIVLTALATVFSGTVVLVASQLVIKFVIEPIHALWKLRGEIADSLIFHANVYMNVGYVAREVADEASNVFRQQACQLLARAHQVPCYGLLERLRVVTKRQNLEGAHRELIGLSNSVHANPQQGGEMLDRQLEFNRIRQEKIVKLLDLKIGRTAGDRTNREVSNMKRLLISVVIGGSAYAFFLGHRTDYLGHYLAGFGGMLLLLAVPRVFWKRPLGWIVPALFILAITFGAVAEATVFRIAIFDPVDFCNQSLGACIAGSCVVGQERSVRSALISVVTGVVLLVLGFGFAFA